MLVAACQRTATPPPSVAFEPSAVPGSLPLKLTTAVPSVSLSVLPTPGAAVLQLTVVEDSPGSAPFLLAVAARSRDGREVTLGTVSLFPIGHAGGFTLPLPRAAAESLAATGGALTFTLKEISADRPLDPDLRVEVTRVELAGSVSLPT
jgi:hypothetical protein